MLFRTETKYMEIAEVRAIKVRDDSIERIDPIYGLRLVDVLGNKSVYKMNVLDVYGVFSAIAKGNVPLISDRDKCYDKDDSEFNDAAKYATVSFDELNIIWDKVLMARR